MREMANYKVIVTARSFGNTDRKAYDLLEASQVETAPRPGS